MQGVALLAAHARTDIRTGGEASRAGLAAEAAKSAASRFARDVVVCMSDGVGAARAHRTRSGLLRRVGGVAAVRWLSSWPARTTPPPRTKCMGAYGGMPIASAKAR